MPNSTLTIYVEGDQDKIIVQNLLVASRLSDNVELIVCGGKQQVANQISTLRDTSSHRHIALIDADLLSVADSSEGARRQLNNPSIAVYCAVPCIEAWLFADDLAARKATHKEQAARTLDRLPLPELIPYPRQLASNVFGTRFHLSLSALKFLREADVTRATARSPSLRAFLSGVSEALGREAQLAKSSLGETMSRDVFSTLLRELPAATIAWRTLNGAELNAEELAKNVLEGTDLGKQYVTEVLRIARDMVLRRSTK